MQRCRNRRRRRRSSTRKRASSSGPIKRSLFKPAFSPICSAAQNGRRLNLAAERIREIELFISLDEQIKFGCRDVTLTGDALRAGEAARRLELNPNLDPTLPPPAPEQKAGDDAIKSGNTESGDAAEAAPAAVGEPAGKVVVKPKTQRQSAPAAKPKAANPEADDAYVPRPGTESTLDAPAVTDDTGDTAAP